MIGSLFALVWGPKIVDGKSVGMHLYFADYAEWQKFDNQNKKPGKPLVYPQPLAVPLGTVLKFHHLMTRWHSEHDSFGNSNYFDSDRRVLVIYTERDGLVGLLLPKLNKVCRYEGVLKTVDEEFPEIFLPFSPRGLEPKSIRGNGTIISCPTTAAEERQVVPSPA